MYQNPKYVYYTPFIVPFLSYNINTKVFGLLFNNSESYTGKKIFIF